MSSEIVLSPTSYIVLGLLEAAGEATPYDLKQGVAGSIGNFWSVPHSQLYAEPDRLAEAGLVTVRRERSGRRRKHYAVTPEGRATLRSWLADPQFAPSELRDQGLLKLFFGADPRTVAPGQIALHRERLAHWEATRAALLHSSRPQARGMILTLDAGIEHAKVWIAYWERLAA